MHTENLFSGFRPVGVLLGGAALPDRDFLAKREVCALLGTPRQKTSECFWNGTNVCANDEEVSRHG